MRLDVLEDATYPSSLLKDPSKATSYQFELMRGISKAEYLGNMKLREALVTLLRASFHGHHGYGKCFKNRDKH